MPFMHMDIGESLHQVAEDWGQSEPPVRIYIIYTQYIYIEATTSRFVDQRVSEMDISRGDL